jgi:hypothetical protein
MLGFLKPSQSKRQTPQLLRRDLKTIALFIQIYCDGKHQRERVQRTVALKTHDVPAIVGRPIRLCRDCEKLLTHAFVMRTRCPLDPKPMCKHCPEHCYVPQYRAQMRAVMRYAGTRLVLRGRLDYLFHLFF